MPKRPSASVPESAIVRLWQQQVQDGRLFLDSEGQDLKVVYPGRPNDSRGGDFRDAVVVSPGGTQQGCIEVHTLTSGWQAHGHHRDPYYNQVVLQVAWRADRGLPAKSQNGRVIPTVLLENGPAPLASRPGGGLVCVERAGRRPAGALEVILEEAGEQRFRQKSGRFGRRMESTAVEQVLYEGLAEALGYSHNQKAFEELARRLSLIDCYSQLGAAGIRNAGLTQSFFLGQAGLLPFQRGWPDPPDQYAGRLEKIWLENHWRALRPAPSWEFYRVRPGNYPVRRMIALSQWLAHDHFGLWQNNYLTPLTENGAEKAPAAWGDQIKVGRLEYWAGNFDFGRPLAGSPSAILGAERAAEMTINVILPFLLAWALAQADSQLAGRLVRIYRCHPPLAVNSIQRHMGAQLALSPGLLNSACRQQGLLHIYKTFCIEGLCGSCPLGS